MEVKKEIDREEDSEIKEKKIKREKYRTNSKLPLGSFMNGQWSFYKPQSIITANTHKSYTNHRLQIFNIS